MWEPPSGRAGFRHNRKLPVMPSVCPGYTTQLPQVWEAIRGLKHWSKGSLREFCGGQPTDAMLMAIEIVDAEVNAQQSWSMAPAAEGGGGK